MQRAKAYYPDEVVVMEDGRLIDLKEWARTHTNLVWTDLECVVAFDDSDTALLLDECGSWEYISKEHLWRKGKFNNTKEAKI